MNEILNVQMRTCCRNESKILAILNTHDFSAIYFVNMQTNRSCFNSRFWKSTLHDLFDFMLL